MTFMKYAVAATLAGALAVTMSTPSQARHGRNAAAIGGFVAGATIGAVAAGAANGYYRGPGYAYEPAYAYQPGYPGGGGYSYSPVDSYYGAYPSCVTQGTYGKPIDYANC